MQTELETELKTELQIKKELENELGTELQTESQIKNELENELETESQNDSSSDCDTDESDEFWYKLTLWSTLHSPESTTPVSQEDIEKFSQCLICTKDFIIHEKVFKLSCGHFYHQKCIREWLEKLAVCPRCGKVFFKMYLP